MSRNHRDPTWKEQIPGGRTFLQTPEVGCQMTTGVGEWDAEVRVEGRTGQYFWFLWTLRPRLAFLK